MIFEEYRTTPPPDAAWEPTFGRRIVKDRCCPWPTEETTRIARGDVLAQPRAFRVGKEASDAEKKRPSAKGGIKMEEESRARNMMFCIGAGPVRHGTNLH